MTVGRDQVVAYRVAAHQLHRVAVRPSELGVMRLGVQDAGSDSSRVALVARTSEELDDPDLEMVWAARGAPHLLPRADLAAVAAALWPLGDADAARRIVSGQVKDAGKLGLRAYEIAAKAMRDVVTEPTPRGEVSTLVSALMPAELVYDCRSCRARHITGGLFQQVGVAAGVRVEPARGGSVLAPLKPRHPIPKKAAGTGALIRSYLHLHGPATIAEAAAFVGTTAALLRPVWPDSLAEVDVDGRKAYLPAEDLPALRDAARADLVRLLPPMDPFLQGRDRAVLVPDKARQGEVWRALGNPGVVLHGVDVIGTWRPKLAGRKRLDLTVSWFGAPAAAVRKRVAQEAELVAAARGAADVTVTDG